MPLAAIADCDGKTQLHADEMLAGLAEHLLTYVGREATMPPVV